MMQDWTTIRMRINKTLFTKMPYLMLTCMERAYCIVSGTYTCNRYWNEVLCNQGRDARLTDMTVKSRYLITKII